MGTTITCHDIAGNITELKTRLSNVLSETLPYGTVFRSVSALSLKKSSKSIKHIHIYINMTRVLFLSNVGMTLASHLRRSASVWKSFWFWMTSRNDSGIYDCIRKSCKSADISKNMSSFSQYLQLLLSLFRKKNRGISDLPANGCR